jgi:DNA-binding IclR family transcriptional regulator
MASAEPVDKSARSVIDATFALLESLHRMGPSRVSDVQRDSALPRTTIHRLLRQLQSVGAAQCTEGRWSVGPTLVELGSGPPTDSWVRDVARRPLLELARLTGVLVALSVESTGHGRVIDVLPGIRPVYGREPRPGMGLGQDALADLGLDVSRFAWARAHRRARRGSLDPVLDLGQADPAVACVAVPLRLSSRDVGAVWLMLPSADRMSDTVVGATRMTAARIMTEVVRSRPSGRAGPLHQESLGQGVRHS